MKRRILMSLLVIGAVVAVIAGATTAYFSDQESATGTLSAGVIDISVDGHNPWSGSFAVADLKPSETKWITFTIHNEGANSAVIWKRLTVGAQTGGSHPDSEWAEDPTNTINNLASWMFYDLKVYGNVVIPAANEVRVDNVNTVWIKLGTLAGHGYMYVEQSYHLRPETTNWAQGDQMGLTIDLLATQTNDPAGPIPASGTIGLVAKDKYWSPAPGTGAATVPYSYASASPGTLTTASFTGTVPLIDTEYSLIYYPDPWPGSGGCVFNTGTSDGSGNITIPSGACTPVAAAADDNMPAGVKIWLVPSTDYDAVGKVMTLWNPGNYLFEENLLPLP